MTTISATGSTSTATTSSSSSGTTSAAEQEDRFMKLLVAQMKNQDPLNPMDNAQMTSQIAQINTVGGIEKLNTTVTSLLTAFNGMQAQSAQQLPGRSVLIEGSQLALANGTATGGVQLAGDADSVNVEILDAAGQTVQTLPLGKTSAGVRSFTWDGRDANGDTVKDGNWRMRVTATASGKAVTATTLTAARVQSVATQGGSTQLDLGAQGSRAIADVQSFL
jgi:flagellar basal-body rod modification protein FlgD